MSVVGPQPGDVGKLKEFFESSPATASQVTKASNRLEGRKVTYLPSKVTTSADSVPTSSLKVVENELEETMKKLEQELGKLAEEQKVTSKPQTPIIQHKAARLSQIGSHRASPPSKKEETASESTLSRVATPAVKLTQESDKANQVSLRSSIVTDSKQALAVEETKTEKEQAEAQRHLKGACEEMVSIASNLVKSLDKHINYRENLYKHNKTDEFLKESVKLIDESEAKTKFSNFVGGLKSIYARSESEPPEQLAQNLIGYLKQDDHLKEFLDILREMSKQDIAISSFQDVYKLPGQSGDEDPIRSMQGLTRIDLHLKAIVKYAEKANLPNIKKDFQDLSKIAEQSTLYANESGRLTEQLTDLKTFLNQSFSGVVTKQFKANLEQKGNSVNQFRRDNLKKAHEMLEDAIDKVFSTKSDKIAFGLESTEKNEAENLLKTKKWSDMTAEEKKIIDHRKKELSLDYIFNSQDDLAKKAFHTLIPKLFPPIPTKKNKGDVIPNEDKVDLTVLNARLAFLVSLSNSPNKKFLEKHKSEIQKELTTWQSILTNKEKRSEFIKEKEINGQKESQTEKEQQVVESLNLIKMLNDALPKSWFG